MNSKLSNERRRAEQRRHIDQGPPCGVSERRVNIERRLFNLEANSLADWLGDQVRGSSTHKNH